MSPLYTLQLSCRARPLQDRAGGAVENCTLHLPNITVFAQVLPELQCKECCR